MYNLIRYLKTQIADFFEDGENAESFLFGMFIFGIFLTVSGIAFGISHAIRDSNEVEMQSAERYQADNASSCVWIERECPCGNNCRGFIATCNHKKVRKPKERFQKCPFCEKPILYVSKEKLTELRETKYLDIK